MNTFDVIILVIVCFCVIRGAFRGIIKEAASVVGVLAGIWAAYTYYPKLSSALTGLADILPSAGYVNIVSFMIIFCVIFAVISAIGVLLKYLLKVVFLGWVDKLCGATFGFIKGFMIVSMLLLILTTFLDQGTPLVKESTLSPYIASASETMSRFGSKDIRHQFGSKIDFVRKIWDKKDEILPEK